MQQCEWPVLKSCVENQLLESIDLLFAQRMLKIADCSREDVGAFLALMMARYRQGHVCFELGQNEGGSALHELAIQGQHHLPESLCQQVTGTESIPVKPICRHGDRFYFQKNWIFETQFLHHYVRLMEKRLPQNVLVDPIPELNAEQCQAVQLGMTSPISLITGGPGTGKTFTAKHLVKASLQCLSPEQKKKFRVILAAPTGKAVTHLEKQIVSVLEEDNRQAIRAGTLHALLQLREDGTQRAPVVLFADLVIVDESSMIDAKMGALLLSAIPLGTRLVLIGDRHQLPAVETGCFFADLIDAGSPSTCLKQSRRVENAQLAELAGAICEGSTAKVQEQLAPFLVSEAEVLQQPPLPFFFIEPPDPETLLSRVDQFQILSCLRQGSLGVDGINRSMLQAFYAQLPHEEGWWAIPIIIARNDYASQLYNGDLGILMKKVGPAIPYGLRLGQEDYALFKGRNPIAGLALPVFEYAYCLSVHKAQGSEYDTVVLVVPEGSARFGKEILYTGITRARKNLRVCASPETIEPMLQKSSRKQSGLSERIKSATVAL